MIRKLAISLPFVAVSHVALGVYRLIGGEPTWATASAAVALAAIGTYHIIGRRVAA